jgi:hypothetical protein
MWDSCTIGDKERKFDIPGRRERPVVKTDNFGLCQVLKATRCVNPRADAHLAECR